MSYASGDHPVAQFQADIEVQEIQMAPELPLDRLSRMYAQVDVSSRDFDEVSLNKVRLGFKGADFSLKGKEKTRMARRGEICRQQKHGRQAIVRRKK